MEQNDHVTRIQLNTNPTILYPHDISHNTPTSSPTSLIDLISNNSTHKPLTINDITAQLTNVYLPPTSNNIGQINHHLEYPQR